MFYEIPSAFRENPEWAKIMENPEAAESASQKADKLLGRFHAHARGYCGWLLLNQQFLQEHDAFFTKWQSLVIEYGLPSVQNLPPEVVGLNTNVPGAGKPTHSIEVVQTTEPQPQVQEYGRDYLS